VFENGCVNSFKMLKNNPWLSENPAEDWPHFVGNANMTTNEAITFAREELSKLGYDPAILHADVSPVSFEGDFDLKQGHFPYCQIKWIKEANTIEEKADAAYVTVQIDMADKTLLGLSIISRKIWGPNPDINVKPELESDYRKRIHPNMVINTNAPKTLK
jgi:hypothetical protein